MRRIGYAFCLIFAFAQLAMPAAVAQDNDYFMYVGTYTGFKYVHHSKTWEWETVTAREFTSAVFMPRPVKSASLNWLRM